MAARLLSREMWNVTWNTWRELNIPSKFQVPRSYGLGVKVCWNLEERMNFWMNEWINYWKRSLWNSPGYTGSDEKAAYHSIVFLFYFAYRCENFCPKHCGTLFSNQNNFIASHSLPSPRKKVHWQDNFVLFSASSRFIEFITCPI